MRDLTAQHIPYMLLFFCMIPGRPAASLRISHRDRIATAPEVRPGARNRPLTSPILKTPDRVLMREARKWRVRSCFNHTGLCAHIISFCFVLLLFVYH